MATRYKQDMPPEGGYGALNSKRVPSKIYFTSRGMFAYFAVFVTTGLIGYKCAAKILRRRTLEYYDQENSLEPFIVAERDRAYLKQLKKNREEEAELMKNVEDWEVGKYFHQPVYRTLPEDYHIDPIPVEYYAHVSERTKERIWNYAFYRWFTVTD